MWKWFQICLVTGCTAHCEKIILWNSEETVDGACVPAETYYREITSSPAYKRLTVCKCQRSNNNGGKLLFSQNIFPPPFFFQRSPERELILHERITIVGFATLAAAGKAKVLPLAAKTEVGPKSALGKKATRRQNKVPCGTTDKL